MDCMPEYLHLFILHKTEILKNLQASQKFNYNKQWIKVCNSSFSAYFNITPGFVDPPSIIYSFKACIQRGNILLAGVISYNN